MIKNQSYADEVYDLIKSKASTKTIVSKEVDAAVNYCEQLVENGFDSGTTAELIYFTAGVYLYLKSLEKTITKGAPEEHLKLLKGAIDAFVGVECAQVKVRIDPDELKKQMRGENDDS